MNVDMPLTKKPNQIKEYQQVSNSIMLDLLFLVLILGCFNLICFFGISTILGYLMPNPFYTYILNI